MTNSVTAAIGPTIGGFLLSSSGWRAIFLINVPVAAISAAIALHWLPPAPSSRGGGLGSIDFAGVSLFAFLMAAVFGFLISVGSHPQWILLGAIPVLAAMLALVELRSAKPFLDFPMLADRPALIAIYLQLAAFTLSAFTIFFGLPIWLEQVRGYDGRTTGLVMLPMSAIGVLVIVIAAQLVNRIGAWASLVAGSVFLLAGSVLLLTLNARSPLIWIIAVGTVLGAPNGFNNVGLQAALYDAAPPDRIGSAAGQFQTFRYLGAMLSAGLLAIAFGAQARTEDLHVVALLIGCAAVALLISSVTLRRNRRSSDGTGQ
jgi:predicted MFS family arabinose efflux permease